MQSFNVVDSPPRVDNLDTTKFWPRKITVERTSEDARGDSEVRSSCVHPDCRGSGRGPASLSRGTGAVSRRPDIGRKISTARATRRRSKIFSRVLKVVDLIIGLRVSEEHETQGRDVT